MGRLISTDACAEALTLLARGGGEFADLFREDARGATVIVEDRNVETAQETRDAGVGLRIRRGGHTGSAHLDDPTPAALRQLARELARAPDGAPSPAPYAVRAVATALARPFGAVPLEEKAALCRRAEAAAYAVDRRVRQVRVTYRDHRRDFLCLSTDGGAVEERQEGFLFSVLAIAADGAVVQTGYETAGGSVGWEYWDGHPPEALAEAAARRAVAMLSAPRAPGGTMPVVLAASAGGTMIHEAVGHGLEADLVADGYSLYGDRMGERVAARSITVLDDPTLPGRRGSYVHDDEGTPAAPTVLVDNGVLVGWLHSRATALAMGHAPNGHGRRESFRHLPIPRMANTYIAPGTEDPASILRRTPRGLYVTRMGGGEVNTLNGDFVFEVAEGFRIEDGEPGEPVRGATLVGNGPEVLCAIDLVGSDLGFSLGTCGKDGQGAPVADAQPTLRIPELVVGGAL